MNSCIRNFLGTDNYLFNTSVKDSVLGEIFIHLHRLKTYILVKVFSEELVESVSFLMIRFSKDTRLENLREMIS